MKIGGEVTRMSILKRTMLTIILVIVLILSACSNLEFSSEQEKVTVSTAIRILLDTENYSSKWEHNKDFMVSGKRVVRNDEIVSKVFHSPYKSKSEFIKLNTEREEIVGINTYQAIRDEEVIEKCKCFLNDGSFRIEESIYGVMSYDKFTTLIRKGLLAEVYIDEEIVDGVTTDKYEITVDPYPFVIFLGLPYKRRDELTKIYLEEYKECTGYAYIDTETNCISKLEFDLAEKSELSDKINQRIEKETDEAWWYTMPEFDELYVSISFYDINDDSDECAAIEKEIDDIMDAG